MSNKPNLVIRLSESDKAALREIAAHFRNGNESETIRVLVHTALEVLREQETDPEITTDKAALREIGKRFWNGNESQHLRVLLRTALEVLREKETDPEITTEKKKDRQTVSGYSRKVPAEVALARELISHPRSYRRNVSKNSSH